MQHFWPFEGGIQHGDLGGVGGEMLIVGEMLNIEIPTVAGPGKDHMDTSKLRDPFMYIISRKAIYNSRTDMKSTGSASSD